MFEYNHATSMTETHILFDYNMCDSKRFIYVVPVDSVPCLPIIHAFVFIHRKQECSMRTMDLRQRKRHPPLYQPPVKRLEVAKKASPMVITEIPEDTLTMRGQKSIGIGCFGECEIMNYKGLFDVCVKRMSGAIVSKQQLLAEARMLTVVSGHRHIPHCFGVCLSKNAIVMTLHLIDDTPLNLETALATDKFSSAQWVGFLRNIADAIQYIHNKNILHNDIKLNNIALGGTGKMVVPFLIDFGKACYCGFAKKYFLNNEEIEEYKKFYPQVAPDLRDGLVKQSFKSDIFSFGRICHVATTATKFPNKYEQVIDACMKYNASERPDMSTIVTFLHTS